MTTIFLKKFQNNSIFRLELEKKITILNGNLFTLVVRTTIYSSVYTFVTRNISPISTRSYILLLLLNIHIYALTASDGLQNCRDILLLSVCVRLYNIILYSSIARLPAACRIQTLRDAQAYGLRITKN